jgi:hypothetical protein
MYCYAHVHAQSAQGAISAGRKYATKKLTITKKPNTISIMSPFRCYSVVVSYNTII